MGRSLALVLAVLVSLALVLWAAVAPPHIGSGVVSTIRSGPWALTATNSLVGCTPYTNGTPGADLYAQFEYELANLGDSPATASVIIALASNVSFRVVAEHAYSLEAHQVVEGAIGADVPVLGSCPAMPLSFGLSTQGHA